MAMTVERITKAKAECLIPGIPALGSILPLKDESATYYLIAEDAIFTVIFTVAIVEDGELTYISDESVRGSFEAWLSNYDSL